MNQQPNINSGSEITNTILDSNMPVPRTMGKKTLDINMTELSEERFSLPGPDSGYALKLIKTYENLWKTHYKNKLISKIIINLVLHLSSSIGRAPTKSDFETVLKFLKINETSLGLLDQNTLFKSSNENINGLHLVKNFESYLKDKL